MIYGYIRVSTDKQTVENQRYEVNQFCARNILVVDKWIEETISGSKHVRDRKLGVLLKKNEKRRHSNMLRIVKTWQKLTNDYGYSQRMYE